MEGQHQLSIATNIYIRVYAHVADLATRPLLVVIRKSSEYHRTDQKKRNLDRGHLGFPEEIDLNSLVSAPVAAYRRSEVAYLVAQRNR